MTVVVFGSINMDLVVRTRALPIPGQTLSGHAFYSAAGGKGANQAVACVRLGVPTRMVGKVGRDTYGDALRQGLRDYGVDVSAVTEFDGPSGVALITIDDNAENTIVVVEGANGALMVEHNVLESVFRGANVLLLQLEISSVESMAAARLARNCGLKVVLDPAPAEALSADFYPLIDVLTPNESEVEQLVGFPVHDEPDAMVAAKTLLDRGVENVIIKMGSKGAYWGHKHGGRLFPAYQVTAIDTVAAGDAFNGAFAAAWSEGKPFEDAIHWGLATAALSVTRKGAQTSMPKQAEVLAMLASQHSR